MNRLTIPASTLAIAAALLAGCGDKPATSPATTSLHDDAQRIAHQYIIVDTHVDVPYRLESKPEDVSVATADGDFDYPRAVAGGLNAPFMSIYTGADVAEAGGSFELANRLIDGVEAMVADHPDKFALALGPDDVREQFAAGLISLPLGMENGSPIGSDLGNVAYFFDRGIRYITLAHSKSNLLSDSSYDDNHQWNGLSDLGRDVVREMNRLGIMVDVSHLSDAAFEDVLAVSTVPVIASHSSARHFTPGFERNMSDDMIRALADKGGIIMINFGSSFLTAEANAYSDARSDAQELYQAEHPGMDESRLEEEFEQIYTRDHGPLPFATLDDVLDHFDHVISIAGADHVGIGSDFDGVGDSLPVGLKDVSAYPALVEGLLERGYTEQEIAGILGENLLRVWSVVEAGAEAPAG